MLSPALGVSQEGLTRPMSRSTDAPQIASHWSTRGSPPTKGREPLTRKARADRGSAGHALCSEHLDATEGVESGDDLT